MSILGFVKTTARDLRYAVRGLARRRAFTIAAGLTLAIGIGATTAIFSVVYSVLIKPLPFPNADELVRIRHSAQSLGVADLLQSPTMLFTYRDENRTFAEIGFWNDGGQTLSSGNETVRLRALRVTQGLLPALGVQPVRGRWFTEEEHGPGAQGPYPVILSHAFWQSRLGGDQSALGRELLIDGRQSQVVGIMPPDFRFLNVTPQPDIIVALQFDPARQSIAPGFQLNALGRLRPGVTPAQARADIERMLPIWLDAWPIAPGSTVTREAIANWRIAPVVRPLKDDLVGSISSSLWLLLGAVGSVLFVACANIANLMLVRADARRQEFAVRAALGAVPARIARELLAESLVIAVAGGMLGLALASAGIRVLVWLGPSSLPRLDEISVYPPVLLFTAAVSLASTLVFGSITALKYALHVDVGALRAARGASTGRTHGKTRNALVVIQVALALVLIVSAVLMIRTFEALRNVDPGFDDPGSIQTVRTWAPPEIARDPRRYARVQRDVLDAIAALPGVESVGFTSNLPIEGPPFAVNAPVAVEGRPLAGGDAPPPRRLKLVSPGYFESMGTRLLAGRDVTWADIDAGGRVALISEEFARELAAQPPDVLGMRIRMTIETDDWREVIGVVQSVKEDSPYADAPSVVYWPALMENAFGNQLFALQAVAYVVRSDRAGTGTLTNEIRNAVWSVNASVPIALELTLQTLYSGSLAQTSFSLVMLAIAGVMALALGIIGIYGVIAYVAAQRSREIGIRLALGAQPRQVLRMFVRQGLALTGVGIAIGLVAALAVTQLMSSLLFGIAATDPAAYGAALGVILAAAALASYLPARRAAAIDPTKTLKSD